MVGGKRRKQHCLRFLELSSCFLFAWGTIFFARKLRNDASFTNHMCILLDVYIYIYREHPQLLIEKITLGQGEGQ